MRLFPAFASALFAIAGSSASAAPCSVSKEERAVASELDWETFDQEGGVRGSFRDLVEKGCHAAAVEAYRAWLERNRGFPDGRAKGIGMFHIGQSLAFTGNREGAVMMIEQSFRDEQVEGQTAIDWNAYVHGVLGFFAGDAERIAKARARLAQSDRTFANRQMTVLAGLRRCLGKPYAEAMSRECRN